MRESNSKRRDVLKTVGAGAAFAGLSGVATASDADVDAEQARREIVESADVDPERIRRDGIPFPDASYIAIGDDVREAVGHNWWLLRMGRDRIDELLQKSSASSNEVSTYGDRVTTLRDTYAIEESAVTSTDIGQKHTYHLTDSDVDPLGRQEEIETAEVANAVIDGFRAEGDDRDDVSSNWFGGVHKVISESVYYLSSIPEDRESDLTNASPDPDTFGCKSCQIDWFPVDLSDKIELKIEQGIRGLGNESDAKHPPFHFYATGADLNVGPISADIAELGGAPGEASYMVDIAESTQGPYKAKRLGWAAHYLQDMSVPLHTGAVLDQINPYLEVDGSIGINPRRGLHEAYETVVSDNMTDSDSGDLTYPFDTNLIHSEELDTPDVATGCRELADVSGPYAAGIFDAVMQAGQDNPENWGNYGTDVFDVTHNCFDRAGAHMRTFVENNY